MPLFDAVNRIPLAETERRKLHAMIRILDDRVGDTNDRHGGRGCVPRLDALGGFDRSLYRGTKRAPRRNAALVTHQRTSP